MSADQLRTYIAPTKVKFNLGPDGRAPWTPSTMAKFTLGCTCLSLLLAGCSEDTSIRVYRVAKEDVQNRSTDSPGTNSKSTEQQRMLAAIVPNVQDQDEQVVWYFKLTGSPDVVAEHEPDFREMVNSVEFSSEGKPQWRLPDGWSEQLSQGMIYANLLHREDGLTATVTQLPFPGELTADSWQGYVLMNVNRWRGQLSLADQQWDQMADDLEELPELSHESAKSYFVNLIGEGSGAMGSAPFASQFGGGGATMTAAPAPRNSSPQAQELKYEVPEGWKELTASGMRRAAFTIEADGGEGEVTVIAAGGSIEANIGIWLGQVSREASSETKQAVIDSEEDVEVNGIAAKVYEIAGGEDSSSMIVVADVPWRSGESLFVKMKGSPELVSSHREKFTGFLKSLQWQ